MSTITIMIGNSDDKLSQREWRMYYVEVEMEVFGYCGNIHFAGGSPTVALWQNYCWVAEITETKLPKLLERLRQIREGYGQESIAVISGETKFI